MSGFGRVVREELVMTCKTLTKVKAEKFTLRDIHHCQLFLDYMSNMQAQSVKFFDETGFHLTECNPVFVMEKRHNTLYYFSAAGKAGRRSNIYNFGAEANHCSTPASRHMLESGDHIIGDNCPTHRYEAAEALAEFLGQRLADYLLSDLLIRI